MSGCIHTVTPSDTSHMTNMQQLVVIKSALEKQVGVGGTMFKLK